MSDPAFSMAGARVKALRGSFDKEGMSASRADADLVQLRRAASEAVRANDHAKALRLYGELASRLPDDATWPERAAGIHRELGQRAKALACLRRALELQVDQGEVLGAIATCKTILEIEPEDGQTLDTLHLLYSEPSMNPHDRSLDSHVVAADIAYAASDLSVEAGPLSPRANAGPDSEAPLMELELTHVIPGATRMMLADAEEGAVTEIPLEDSRTADPNEASQALDLRLDEPAPPPRRAARPSSPATRPSTSPPPRPAQAALADTPLFGSLAVDDLKRLMERVRVVRLSAGDALFRQGDPANALYVVADGAVVPIAEGPSRRRLAVLEKGDFFGEIGLVTNQPRNATVEALVDARLLAIDRRVMWSLVRGGPAVSKVLLRFLRERLIDYHMRTNPFFEAFAKAERSAVVREFRFLEIRDGSCVVRQGSAAQGLILLLAGHMDVIDSRTEKLVGSLRAGDFCGGLPLIQRHVADYSVVATGKCWALVLPEARFRRIMKANPGLQALLVRLACTAGNGELLV